VVLAKLGTDQMSMDLEGFARGLVAALVEQGRPSIQPKRPEHLRGFYSIQRMLEKEVSKAAKSGDKAWLQEVTRLRNRLSPGPAGSFDQFETALRGLQLSFTESPNVYYEDIEFTVSKPFATSTLDRMEDRERALVKRAAAAFMGASAT